METRAQSPSGNHFAHTDQRYLKHYHTSYIVNKAGKSQRKRQVLQPVHRQGLTYMNLTIVLRSEVQAGTGL